ncbi:MAG: hypothetical protein EBS38_03195 [Actinobacteria bacterium]|nr:hypothetical protein [Actinomycetota bacterium]
MFKFLKRLRGEKPETTKPAVEQEPVATEVPIVELPQASNLRAELKPESSKAPEPIELSEVHSGTASGLCLARM